MDDCLKDTNKCSSKKALKEVLLKYLVNLHPCGGASPDFHQTPEFDYYALDYLDFAEMDFCRYKSDIPEVEKENALLSCLSNLKKALDCQMECFLGYWNLRAKVKKGNLGIDKKLMFFSDIGLFSSGAINRFSKLRNRIEHDFKKPEIGDLEAILDLVKAFVTILQTTMTPTCFSYLEVEFYFEDNKDWNGYLNFEYKAQELKFIVNWEINTIKNEKESIEVVLKNLENLDEFIYLFRIMILLNQFNGFTTYDHIRKIIDKKIILPSHLHSTCKRTP